MAIYHINNNGSLELYGSQDTGQSKGEITILSSSCWPRSYWRHPAGGGHLVGGGLPQAGGLGVRVGSENFLSPGCCGFHVAGDVIVLQAG